MKKFLSIDGWNSAALHTIDIEVKHLDSTIIEID